MMATPKALISLAIFAGSIAFTVPASADVRTMEVRVDDLDLTRPSAQDRLQERIDRAVRKVCVSNVTRNAGERNDTKRCEADARADAEAQATDRIADHKNQRRAQLARD
jgi:UrcA family protein